MSEEQKENITKKKSRKTLIVGLITVLVIAVVAVFIYVSGRQDRKLKEALQLAEKYLNELDYEKAVAAYEDAINIDPKCLDAYIGIADIYVAMADESERNNDYETAIKDCDSSLETLNQALNQENDDSETITVKITEINSKKEEIQKKLDEQIAEEQNIKEEEEKKAKLLGQDTDLSMAEIGETVIFGHNKKDGLCWIVLDKKDNSILLIEKDYIRKECYRNYKSKLEDYYEDCFFEEEYSRILDTQLDDTLNNNPFLEDNTKIEKEEIFPGDVHVNSKGNYFPADYYACWTYVNTYELKKSNSNNQGKLFLLSLDEADYYNVNNVVLRNQIHVKTEPWIYETDPTLQEGLKQKYKDGLVRYDSQYGYLNPSDVSSTDMVAAKDEEGNIITYREDEKIELRPAIWVSIN